MTPAIVHPSESLEGETERLLALERDEAQSRGRRGLLNFICYTNDLYQVAPHHAVACRLLNAFIAGRIKRLIIVWPPRHGKSEIVSRNLPAFALGLDPDKEIIAASYSASLASAMNRDVQRVISLPQYRALFPNTQLNEKSLRTNAKGTWLRNSETFQVVGFRGRYQCAGVGGALTGKGGELVIIDDPTKNWEDASSPAMRDKQWDWYGSTLYTRLSKDAGICIATTRWNEDDLVGRLLALAKADPEADQWVVLHMPALMDMAPTAYDPRQTGEALWADRFPATRLKQVQKTNPRAFLHLYQGRPSPLGGNLVAEAWWKYVRWSEIPFDSMGWWRISADLNLEERDKNDPTVMQVWGGKGADRYCIDQFRAPADLIQQCAMLMELMRKHPYVQGVMIEKAANGAALISVIKSQIGGVVPVIPRGSKYARAEACAPQIEAGNVFILHPDESPWTRDFVLEWSQFPSGKHDDMVDATSQLLNQMREETSDELIIPLRQKTSRWRRNW